MPSAELIVRRLWEEGKGQTRGQQLAYIVEHRSHDIEIFDLFESCIEYGVLNAMDMLVVARNIPDGHVFDRFQELVMERYFTTDMRNQAMRGVPHRLVDIISRQFDIVFGLDMVSLLQDTLRPSCYVFRPVAQEKSFAACLKSLRV